MTVPVPEKLPARMAAGGNERNCDAEPDAWLTYGPPIVRCTVDSMLAKKNNLSRLIGPPIVPPNTLLLSLVFSRSCRKKIVAGPYRVMGQVFESRTVQRVRAALNLHVHRRTAGHALFSVEAVRDDVHRLDGLNRRRVGLQTLNPLVRRADTVETEHRVRGRARH